MAYRMKTMDEVNRVSTRVPARFAESSDVSEITSLPTAVMSWILDSVGFADLVNTSVQWDPSQCRVTPGDAVKAMVLTMTMDAYRPALENVARRFCGQPVGLMFDSVSSAADLDPDMLARTLDRVHDADPVKLFMTVSAALRSRFGIVSKIVHSDTTSVSVRGTYDVDDPESMTITRGYSKDRRPDLLQFMIGAAVDENGFSDLSMPLDGNAADSEWNGICLDLLKDVLKERNLIYVADSKLVNGPLVDRMIADGTMFLSRCPEGFEKQLQRKVLASVDTDSMEDIGIVGRGNRCASRKIFGTDVIYKGTVLRAIAVKSDKLAGRGDRAVLKSISAAEDLLSSFRTEYHCQKDAADAFLKLSKKISKTVCRVSAEYVHDVAESRPRGRPRKDGTDVRRADRWTVDVTSVVDEEKREALWRSKEMIVLLSNLPMHADDSGNGMSDADLVKLYANEWKVEGLFKTLKTPMMVRRIFLKTPGRAEALVEVVLIAALVRAVMQLLIRRGLEDIPDSELPDYGYGRGRLQRTVTSDFFIDSCTNCRVIREGGRFFFGKGTDERSRFYLDLIGISPEALFTPSLV